MVLSVQIADLGMPAALGLLRGGVDPRAVPGMRYAQAAATTALGGNPLLGLARGQVALIAAWDGDEAFERFLAEHPVAERLAGGWRVRLEPMRCYGAWPPLPELERPERRMDDDEPVAVLTLGRLRLTQTARFLRTSRPAERLAVASPALVAGSALARPARFVATFSIWRSTAEMRAYAAGRDKPAHADAMRAHRAEPFHHESAFVRLRPYAAEGLWNGVEPLALALGKNAPHAHAA